MKGNSFMSLDPLLLGLFSLDLLLLGPFSFDLLFLGPLNSLIFKNMHMLGLSSTLYLCICKCAQYTFTNFLCIGCDNI